MTMNGGGTVLWGPEVVRPGTGPLRVGRGADADVRLLHPAVSRQHAQLHLVGGRLVVQDLGSRLGVRVNGRRVREEKLGDGDRLEFGPVAYQVAGQQLHLLQQPEGMRLEASELGVARGGRTLLTGVGLGFAPGQFVGVLGGSGSGKTTLIKCLVGYVPPAAGRLSFDGLDLPANLDSYRDQVGYVPQEDVLYYPLTGRENLEFALRLRTGGDRSFEERQGTVNRALERLHLLEHADKRVAVLSGGQRKRLNVAVELLTQPRILFLDEPTSGLDPASELRLMQALKELAGQGTTVVCATHVLQNVGLFDQVIVVAAATVVYSGPPEHLLRRFGVPGYPELYERLEGLAPGMNPETKSAPADQEATGVARILDGIQLVKTRAKPGPTTAAGTSPRIGVVSQVVVQFLRGLRLILRDPWLLLLLVSQPVLIGLLINLSQIRPNGLEPIFLFAVVTAIWLGLNILQPLQFFRIAPGPASVSLLLVTTISAIGAVKGNGHPERSHLLLTPGGPPSFCPPGPRAWQNGRAAGSVR
jgi:ABC-type multidrug transport system ATPase subunit